MTADPSPRSPRVHSGPGYRTLLVAPTGHGVGLTSVCMGLLRAAERLGLRAGFIKPIGQAMKASPAGPERAAHLPRLEHTTALVRATTPLYPPDPIPGDEAERLLSENDIDGLMERVIERMERATGGAELVIVEGLWAADQLMYSTRVNQALARTLDADVLLVGAPRKDRAEPAAELAEEAEIAARVFSAGSIAGVVVNLLHGAESGTPRSTALPAALRGTEQELDPELVAPYAKALAARGLKLVGAIPLRKQLMAPRVADLARAIGATVLIEGDLKRRAHEFVICGRAVPGVLRSYKPGTLLIAPSDRHDILMSASLAALSGTRLAGLLLTWGDPPDPRVLDLCRRAFDGGLPLLSVQQTSFEIATALTQVDLKIPLDDLERAEAAMNHVAGHIDLEWLRAFAGSPREHRLSPAAFRHQLIQRARRARARIVLPEGDEPRTIAAATICQERGIARCVLLGEPGRVRAVAEEQGITLPADIEILDPATVAESYVAPMVELRKHKGLTAAAATEQLQDTVMLGTMMLKLGHVQGLVSGAVHTTAHTIRPALQLIRTKEGCSLVSSCFFMCLPEQVLVFADCAVNPDPTAEELADIAITTADTAQAFGIEPRVAMISYATGSSAEGTEVEKVTRATALVRERRPEMLIDGPLQYDAAAVPSVGAQKAPGSPVAGRARVFIFPDLNTGNTTYKAVQRSAGVVSIGPVLQGMARPVNDLSRGALVEDIVFTIALTAIQAGG